MTGFGQLMGVDRENANLLAKHAATLARVGKVEAARDAFRVLTDLEPLAAEHWKAWSQLERRAGCLERAEGLEEVASWFE